MKKFKVIINSFIAIFIVMCICNYMYVTNKKSEVIKKSVCTRYLDNPNIKYAKGICKTKKQEIKYADYTITLDEVIYDSKTKLGYAAIKYEKEDGKPYIKLNKWGEHYKGLVDERFMIQEHVLEKDYRYEGDNLYQYVCFEIMDEDKAEIHILDENIEICEFTLDETSTAKVYSIDKNTEIYISNLAVMIKSNKEMSKMDLKVFYNNGNSEVLIKAYEDKESGLLGIDLGSIEKCDGEEDKVSYLNIFNSIKDINSIKYINFNGKEFK